jgi:hypothetical protein
MSAMAAAFRSSNVGCEVDEPYWKMNAKMNAGTGHGGTSSGRLASVRQTNGSTSRARGALRTPGLISNRLATTATPETKEPLLKHASGVS